MIEFIRYRGAKGSYKELRLGDFVWLNGKRRVVKSAKSYSDRLIIDLGGKTIKFGYNDQDFPIQLAEESLPVIERNCSHLLSLEDLRKNYDYDQAVKLLHRVFLRTVKIIDRKSPEFIKFIENIDPYDLWGPGVENYVYEKTGIKRID